MKFKILLLVLTILIGDTAYARAGSCRGSDEQFKTCIENPRSCADHLGYCLDWKKRDKAPKACQEIYALEEALQKPTDALKESLECYPHMAWNRHPTLYTDKLHQEKFQEKWRQKRLNSEEKDWAYLHIGRVLQQQPILKCEAAFQLAPYGHPKVYATLTSKECDNSFMKHWGLLLLRDPRAANLFVEYFLYFDQKYKTHHNMARHDKLFALAGILWTKPERKKVEPFLTEQLDNPRNKNFRSVIQRVLDSLE